MPWKVPTMSAGKVFEAVCCTSRVASPRATPGLRLKLMVTAGNCPRWLTVSGPTEGTSFETVSSGTSFPVFERM